MKIVKINKKLKVGDFVHTKDIGFYQNSNKDYNGCIHVFENLIFNNRMKKYLGKKARILSISYDKRNERFHYKIDVDNGRWTWIEEFFK